METLKEKVATQEQDSRVNIQRLEYELNRSLRIQQKLTQRLAQKEHEIALLSVQIDDLKAGFEALRKQYEEQPKAE